MGKRRAQNRGNAAGRLVQADRPLDADATPERYAGAAAMHQDDSSDMDASTRFEDARDQVRRQAEVVVQNPIGLALGGLAVGFLVGLALPISEIERDRLGDVGGSIADQVQTQVQAIGQDVVQHGKAVLAETLQATVVGGKNPVEAATQSVQEHLSTVAQNAQSRVEDSFKSSST